MATIATPASLESLAPSTTVWTIDPAHTGVEFAVRHLMISTVKGRFGDVKGTVELDLENPAAARVDVTIGAASIDTRNADRDAHLRSADFFDVEKWPDIRFVSTQIEEVEENAYMVSGDLTIRDITKHITVPLELMGVEKDAFGALRAGFEGSRRVNRRDFGLEWNMPLDSGGVLVSEKISLEFEISAIKRGSDAQDDAQEDGAKSAEG